MTRELEEWALKNIQYIHARTQIQEHCWFESHVHMKDHASLEDALLSLKEEADKYVELNKEIWDEQKKRNREGLEAEARIWD